MLRFPGEPGLDRLSVCPRDAGDAGARRALLRGKHRLLIVRLSPFERRGRPFQIRDSSPGSVTGFPSRSGARTGAYTGQTHTDSYAASERRCPEESSDPAGLRGQGR